ncbi:hypothetical protein LTR95_016657 [Oleoguttula sp. CCFEE 5521]
MSTLTIADLPLHADRYKSSRALYDVLLGDDFALPLIEASSSGDSAKLQQVLSEPDAAKKALKHQYVIYHDHNPEHAKDEERAVLAMPMSNIQRAIMKAAYTGHASVIPILAKFAKTKCRIKRADFLDRLVLVPCIRKGDVAVLQALGESWPASFTIDMDRWGNPLDVALNFKQWPIVTMLLEHGVSGRSLTKNSHTYYSYRASWLSLSARAEGTRLTEVLFKQGFTVAGSGALHSAAELGRLDVMRLLLEHDADVNDLLPEKGLIMAKDNVLLASWTPMHFAASGGELGAMTLLEEHGANSRAEDKDGRTPAQLLDGREQAYSS